MTAHPDRLIALPEVTRIAGIGKTMVYRLMRQDAFPKACKPGGASSRWSEREVSAWVAEQLEQRDSGASHDR